MSVENLNWCLFLRLINFTIIRGTCIVSITSWTSIHMLRCLNWFMGHIAWSTYSWLWSEVCFTVWNSCITSYNSPALWIYLCACFSMSLHHCGHLGISYSLPGFIFFWIGIRISPTSFPPDVVLHVSAYSYTCRGRFVYLVKLLNEHLTPVLIISLENSAGDTHCESWLVQSC